MSREDNWAGVSALLSWAVWGSLIWIVWDPDLQGLQEAIGWWMIAIALAPVLLTAVWAAVFDEPGAGGDACGSDDVHWTHGEESCGSRRYGCGG
ncbi:hypothetical protein ACFW7J_12405 [Streptomyces sp. NPDC059525]|uniref:hypothetical protein n=1 Tax=Streptomyces sp. NPDC059525 TaxID=3346857 RepID=UPI0036A42852